MFHKSWQTVYADIEIVVHNSWNLLGSTVEEILINGQQVHYLKKSFWLPLKRILGYRKDFEINGTHITVKVGNSPTGTSVACQILINGDYYHGDREVLFAD
ncbi:hypothetical protein ACM67B_10210 [Neisseria sp. CCUG17229]|uniref:hypothetical protein n=1 Tax=Neisseria sp. CCUG17229 TaxID=3392036 RepID=UPI003A101C91